MTEEFNLSEKIQRLGEFDEQEGIYTGDVKEFIKIVEKIIIERKSRRLQLIELRKSVGNKLK